MDIIDEIIEHSKETHPQECCGLVIVFKGKEKYIRCNNKATEPREDFFIDPLDYARAEDLGTIIKVVHSHVYKKPEPSVGDLIEMEKHGLPWIIVNSTTGEWGEFKPSGYKHDLLGRPFKHGILDCYSLVKDYFKINKDIELPEYYRQDKWWENGQNLYLENFAAAGFRQIFDGSLQKDDCFLMTLHSKVPNHSAVYLGDSKIMHHVQGRLSSIDVYGGYWQKATWGVFRYEGN